MELWIYRAFLTGPLVFDIMRFNCTLFLGDPYFYNQENFRKKLPIFWNFFLIWLKFTFLELGEFLIGENYNWWPILHHHKFCEDRSNRC